MKMKDIFKNRKRVSELNSKGAEVLDEVPLQTSVGIRRPPTQEQRLMAILQRHELLKRTDQDYVDETDFDIDEPDMLTRYEQYGVVYEVEPNAPMPSEEGKRSATKANEEKPSSSAPAEE